MSTVCKNKIIYSILLKLTLGEDCINCARLVKYLRKCQIGILIKVNVGLKNSSFGKIFTW